MRLQKRRRLRRVSALECLEQRRVLAAFTVVNNNDAGPGSLRQAVLDANALTGADEITFDSALSGQTIALSGGELELSETLTIDATSLPEKLTIDANDLSRIFRISASTGDFLLAGLNIVNGFSFRSNGGAISNSTSGKLTILDSQISDSLSRNDSVQSFSSYHTGGGISSGWGDLELINSTVERNRAAAGGGISSIGKVSLINSKVADNVAIEGGGGIYLWTSSGLLTAVDSEVSGNTVSGSNPFSNLLRNDGGGGIRAVQTSVFLTNSSVNDNTVAGLDVAGGGIYVTAADVEIIDSVISGNTIEGLAPTEGDARTSALGGGLSAVGNFNVTIDNSIVSDNHTIGEFSKGGGLSITSGATLEISNSTVAGNSTTGTRSGGGGIFSSGSVATIDQSNITSNLTRGNESGGGGFYSLGDDLRITDTTIDRNKTTGEESSGGGISIDYSRLAPPDATQRLVRTTISSNSTTGLNADGGGIAIAATDTVIFDSVIEGNSTSGDFSQGGGVSLHASGVELSTTLIYGNQTSGRGSSGGGVDLRHSGASAITDSSVFDNSVRNANGGGIHLGGINTVASLVNVTVSSNVAERREVGGFGGGIFAGQSHLDIGSSTVTRNEAMRAGGGIQGRSIEIKNSIIAGNLDDGSSPDVLLPTTTSSLDAHYSLIGDSTGSMLNPGNGNLLDVDPELGRLSNNGGPTLTHALLAGSPAIDAGDPTFLPPPYFDQRGVSFDRVFDGDNNGVARVDMGAFESHRELNVADFVINAGERSRSMITSVSVTFDQLVDHTTLAEAFEVTNIDSDTLVSSILVNPIDIGNRTVVTLTFDEGDSVVSRVGTGVLGNSLADGNYKLDVKSELISAVSGASMVNDHVFGGQKQGQSNNDDFFRLYGDANGDGRTNLTDFVESFLPSFEQRLGDSLFDDSLDADGDGVVNINDFVIYFLPSFGAVRN